MLTVTILLDDCTRCGSRVTDGRVSVGSIGCIAAVTLRSESVMYKSNMCGADVVFRRSEAIYRGSSSWLAGRVVGSVRR